MFCPQCSNEIVSERARFCTRCSFPLANVKEFVETEVAKSKAEEEKKKYPLRQSDISLGAGLMIIGLIPNTAQPLLPQMQSSAVVETSQQEMKTKEPIQPFSITEDSTSLLNKG